MKVGDDSVATDVITRGAAWLVTGPIGHLIAGVVDWLVLLSRWGWARARGRRLYP